MQTFGGAKGGKLNKSHNWVLITGPGGSGKTTLSRYFESKGKNAVDADLAGIGVWMDQGGTVINVPKNQDMNEINKWAEENNLQWHWKRENLGNLLLRYEEVFVVGDAKNAFQLSRLFDHVYYLHASEQLILDRLVNRAESGDSYHDNGRTHEQQVEILGKIEARTKEAKERGFEFVDAALTPEEIFKFITKR